MKQNENNKILVYLGVFVIILLSVFIFSLTPLIHKQTPSAVESALLNPKYIDGVVQICITAAASLKDSSSQITLNKFGDVWIGESSLFQGQKWPVQKETVENFLKTYTNILKMYKKADGMKNWQSLSVDENNATKMVFYSTTGEIVSEVYLGVDDPLTNRIAVRSGSKQTVYETDDAITLYATTDTSFWSDPYIFAHAITEESDNEDSLRHGLLVPVPLRSEEVKQPLLIRKSFGNGSEIMITVYKGDDSYILVPDCVPRKAASKEESNAIRSLSYAFSISSWTYQKLAEESGRK